MVLDILKSDDGKKAIKDANDSVILENGKEKVSILSTNETLQLQTVVKDVLTDKNTTQFLTNMMKDPKFAGDFAKAIQKENKQLQKDLMKDPDYQKQVIDLMKTPDYESVVLDTMKAPQYRQQMMSVIQESMQSPLFKVEMIELLKKAVEEQLKAQTQSLGGGTSAAKSKSQGGDKKSGDKDKSSEKSDEEEDQKK
jgi:spore germination protein D